MPNETKNAKKSSDVTAVVTREAAKNLKAIAREIFNDYEEEHKELHIHVPSSRVALDYLIAMAKYNGLKYAERTTVDGNLWMMIGKPMQEE